MSDTEILSCPACSSKRFVDIATVSDVEIGSLPDLFVYRNCLDCDSIYIANQPRERLHLIYPQTYYAYTGSSKINLLEKVKNWIDARLFKRILKTIPGKELAVLDIGGGTGWIASLTRSTDSRIIYTAVVDLNEGARAVAEANGHKFFCQRIEDFEADRKFDLIIMLNIIEHVADPKMVMQRARNLLSTNGRILIKTPNTQTMDRYLFQKHYWGGYHAPRHWVLFNAASFAGVCASCNLEIDFLTYTQGAPQWAQSILGTLAKKNAKKYSAVKSMNDTPAFKILIAIFAAFDLLRCRFFKTAQMFIVLRHAKQKQNAQKQASKSKL